MRIIDNEEYWDTEETAKYLNIGLDYMTELVRKLKPFKIDEYRQCKNYYKKTDIEFFNKNIRKHQKYIRDWFNGNIEKINENFYKLDGIEFKDSEYLRGYFVSKNGNKLYKVIEGKLLDISIVFDKNRTSVLCTRINGKGKSFFIHRLVLEAFGFPKPFEKAVVRHLDDNSENNNFDNLKWGTQKENILDYMKHHYTDKLLRLFLKEKYPEIYNEFVQIQKTIVIHGNKTGGLTFSLEPYNASKNKGNLNEISRDD